MLGALSFARPRRRLSSAPTADFQRRRAQKLSRPGRRSAIEAHSDVSRPRLDSFEHGGRLDDRGPEESSGPFGLHSRGLMSLPDPSFSTRSRVAGRTMASGFRRRYLPDALNKRLAQEESRGRRGPSQQGQRSAARCGEGIILIDLRRLELQLQRSIGTSCLWSTCDAG